jgi:hypothetical protein
MHGLLAELWPWVAAFYLLDALVLVRPHQWLFLSRWGGRFRVLAEGLWLAGVSPLAEAVLAEEPPVLVSREALFVLGRDVVHEPRVARPDDLEAVPFAALGRAKAYGRDVAAGGRRLLTTATPAAAERTAALLRELSALAPAERMAAVARSLDEAFDLAAARSLRERALRAGRPLPWACTALFAVGLLAMPLALYRPAAWTPDAVAVFLVALAAYLVVVALALRLLRYCGLGRGRALAALSPLLLFPPAAMHARSLVTRQLFARFHPLTVAATLLDAEGLRRLAARELALHDLLRARDAGGEREEYWRAREAALSRLLSGAGVAPGTAREPARLADPEAAAWCPACDASYRRGFERCSDCGVALRAVARA